MFKSSNYNSIYVCTSDICNLNCSYCYLKHKPTYAAFHKKVMEAWKDGSYAKNIVETANAVCDVNKITWMNLMGGETSYGCREFADNLSTIKGGLPSLEGIYVATNFGVNIENLEYLITKVNEVGIPYMTLQLSIDGIDDNFSKNGHDISKEAYERNYDHIINFLQSAQFDGLKRIVFSLRSTASLQTILNEFDTVEKISQYIINYYQFYRNCVKKADTIKGVRVLVDMRLPDIESPFSSTTEEGLAYATVLKRYQSTLMGYPEYREFMRGPNKGGKFNSFMKLHKWQTQGNYMTQLREGCSSLTLLTIMPDGSISYCGDQFGQIDADSIAILKNEDYFEYIGQVINQSATRYVIGVSDKELTNKTMSNAYTWDNGVALYYAMDAAIANELAKSGQILRLYEDNPEKVKADHHHQFWLHCPAKNLLRTHTVFLPSVGSFRATLNGAGDFEQEWLIKEIKGKYGV